MRIIDGNIFEGMRMIIPEHREAMIRMARTANQAKKPLLSQDCFEEMSVTLAMAIQNSQIVKIKTYQPFGSKVVEMIPYKIDPYTRVLKGRDQLNEPISIPLTDILDVQI